MSELHPRLVFEIATPQYIGSSAFTGQLLEAIESLPNNLLPNRCKSTAISGKQKLSLQDPSALTSIIPGRTPYEGDASLYRTGPGFSLDILWKGGDAQWFSALKKKPFNDILGCLANGPKALSDPVLTDVFLKLWLQLCEITHAAYGYVYLQDPCKGARPRGKGLCLPRLHWRTYLGAEYAAALNFDAIRSECKIEAIGGGILISTAVEPTIETTPGNKELAIIQRLGPSFFWRETDSWKTPLGPYEMPDLNWSVILNSSNN